jgi:hypothetical protein
VVNPATAKLIGHHQAPTHKAYLLIAVERKSPCQLVSEIDPSPRPSHCWTCTPVGIECLPLDKKALGLTIIKNDLSMGCLIYIYKWWNYV